MVASGRDPEGSGAARVKSERDPLQFRADLDDIYWQSLTFPGRPLRPPRGCFQAFVGLEITHHVEA